jgi:hypothetical protein
MNPQIASLHGRMAKGGDWRSFRDEIAALHETTKTEQEYVTLLEAHRNLVAVGEHAFDKETYEKLLHVTATEYRMFLNKEAMEDGLINPVLLERITRREVEAGRLTPDDEFRQLAAAGAAVLGDSKRVTPHQCRKGDWFLYGVLIAASLSVGLASIPLSPLWLILPGLVAGWYLNEREHKQ